MSRYENKKFKFTVEFTDEMMDIKSMSEWEFMDRVLECVEDDLTGKLGYNNVKIINVEEA